MSQITGSERVGIIGLGYVGLTVAVCLADIGFHVHGVEKRKSVVDLTNAGEPHFEETGLQEVLQHVLAQGNFLATQSLVGIAPCDIYFITVGTPLNAEGRTELEFIRSATKEVADSMPDGALVILRSTVRIGTTRNTVAPILESSGKAFQIAMCPERTLEGRAMQELRSLPQIVGADDAETRTRAAQFFHKLTHTVVQVTSLETAEIVKLVDNTYRDVQFGFANEVARICDAYGVSANEVIKGGKLGYDRTNVALPGLVGGPCLEKDPHILTQSLEDVGVTLDIAPSARRVNERQPDETVEFIVDQIQRRGLPEDSVVSVLGMAFKGVPATDDLRGSMAFKVLDALSVQMPNATVRVFDPVCAVRQLEALEGNFVVCETLDAAIEGAAVAIITNNHPALCEMTPVKLQRKLSPRGFVYDYWNHFSDLRAHQLGEHYFAVGCTGYNLPTGS